MDVKAIIENYRKVVTEKYFCFEGRTGRKSFWFFVLVNFVINMVLGIIPGIAGAILSVVFALAILCPSLGITARRLHDTGKSGWFQLIALIPLVGVIILLILCAKEGDAAENAFGAADAE